MDTLDVLETGKKKICAGEALELAHIVHSDGSTPRSTDAYMIVDAKGGILGTVGGGNGEYHAILDGRDFLQAQEDGEKTYIMRPNDAADLGLICGGTIVVQFIYLAAKTNAEQEKSCALLTDIIQRITTHKITVHLFGGGHVSLETARVLHEIGFETIVYDDRAEFVTKERFPYAKKLVAASYDDAFRGLSLSEKDFVLIMTRGHLCDYAVQKHALKTKAGFIGLIGSHQKINTSFDKLRKDGFTESDIARFYAPVGLQIGAETPEEIAISIAAELILARAVLENRRKVREHKTLDLLAMRHI